MFSQNSVTNRPKIVLECISARTALSILLVTWFSGIACFSLDSYLTYRAFDEGMKFDFSVKQCDVAHESVFNTSSFGYSTTSWGCLGSDNVTWRGLYTDMENILSSSASLVVKQDSFVDPPTRNVLFDLSLHACNQPFGCGVAIGTSSLDWHLVLRLSQEVQLWYLLSGSDTEEATAADQSLSEAWWAVQFYHILQNQEALPSNGYVKSYFLEVKAYDGDSKLPLQLHSSDFFHLGVSESRSKEISVILNAFTIILLLAVAAALGVYIYLIDRYQIRIGGPDQPLGKWLPEQIWTCAYICICFLFLNPFYVAQDLSESDPGEALAAYVFSYVGQTALMVVWLCLADSISYDGSSIMSATLFYIPKIAFGVLVFIPACVVVAYQFPSFSVDIDRSPVEAIQMWPKESKLYFCYFSFTFLVLYWCWALYWFVRLYLTYKKLGRLPYMSTRYQQLLFRFYLLQASLVTTYYVLQYALGAHYIAQDNFGEQDLTEMADEVNTLFKQQTEQFGKSLFLSILAALLAFVTLPSAFLLESDTLSAFTSAFALTEAEKMEMAQQRRDALGGRELRRGETIFCMDVALTMLRLSLEAYNETVGGIDQVRESMTNNLKETGYTVVEIISRANIDLLCVVCKHEATKKLVVAFRGSVSRQNMKMNFDHELVNLDLSVMTLPDLDAQDGLEEEREGDVIPSGRRPTGKIRQTFNKLKRASGGALRGLRDGKSSNDSLPDLEAPQVQRQREREQEQEQELHVCSNGEVSLDQPVDSPLASLSSERSTPACVSELETSQQSRRRLSREGSTVEVLPVPPSSSPEATTTTGSTTLDTMTGVVTDGVDKVAGVVSSGVDKGNEILLLALHHTIGLSSFTTPRVHKGFKGSYFTMRDEIHSIVRRELKKEDMANSRVFFTGHSLGGALATLCALDCSVHTLPRVRAYHRRTKPKGKEIGAINPTLYTYGQPRVGDPVFRSMFDVIVPDAFRVVVDGDVVTSVPKNANGYRHAGTSVVTDSPHTGNIIVDPSFVERFFRTSKLYLGVSVHLVDNYKQCLLAARNAALHGQTGVVVDPEILEKRKVHRESALPEHTMQGLRDIIGKQVDLEASLSPVESHGSVQEGEAAESTRESERRRTLHIMKDDL